MSCWIIYCLGSAQKLAGFQDGLWAHVFLNHLIGAKTENIYTACGHIFESSYWRETENIYSMWMYFWIILLSRKLKTSTACGQWTYFWIILLSRKLKTSIQHVDIFLNHLVGAKTENISACGHTVYLNYLIGAKTENIYSMWTYFFRILLFPSSILWIGIRHFLCCLARVLFWGETFSYFKLDTRDTDVWLPGYPSLLFWVMQCHGSYEFCMRKITFCIRTTFCIVIHIVMLVCYFYKVVTFT